VRRCGSIEHDTGVTLGGALPLLVSVRSSPPTSMPGMLTTVLNVGMSEESVRGLIRRTGNPWLAWDSYRRLIRSFAAADGNGSAAIVDRTTAEYLAHAHVDAVEALDPIALRDLVRSCAGLLPSIAGKPLPVDPLDQIVAAVEIVLQSWMSAPAREYRRLNGIDERTGTGVIIQAMVFGNSGPRSGSGVGFTRNPATGERDLYVDFTFNAQGDDIVGGRSPVGGSTLLPTILPDVWRQLQNAQPVLECEYRDMQDFEFTVENGQLFFRQTRSGKRTPWAALRIATDMVAEHILQPAAALTRLASYDLDAVKRVVVRPRPDDVALARAVPAGVGVAAGSVVFDARRAQQTAAHRPVILVRSELTTDDLAGLAVSDGVLTTFGGRTSHAAVVARQLGKVCLVGCTALHVADNSRECSIGRRQVREGETIRSTARRASSTAVRCRSSSSVPIASSRSSRAGARSRPPFVLPDAAEIPADGDGLS
jgi:pyruvate, orthophosphate dikinase